MTAFLVEQHPKAYAQLSMIPPRFPDIEIMTYPDDFISVVPRIVADIPRERLRLLLRRPEGLAHPAAKAAAHVGAAKVGSDVQFHV